MTRLRTLPALTMALALAGAGLAPAPTAVAALPGLAADRTVKVDVDGREPPETPA